MTVAEIGYGAAFGISNDDSPETFTDMAEVFNITPPTDTVDVLDATHMASADRRREFIRGLIDSGETSFEMNFEPGSTSDTTIQAKVGAAPGNYRITFPDGTSGSVTWIFSGIMTGYDPAVPNEDKMTATVTIKVTGSKTIGTL